MTTDIKNLQILKAMYAAADAIIEAGYYLLKEPLTAAQIDKEMGKDKLVTDGLSKYDQSNWLKAGSYEGFTLTDEGLTINITVGSFSCSMVYASIFRMIAKFEKLCGVSASKAKKFANKQEQKQMVYAVKVTKELKTLPAYASKNATMHPAMAGIYFDLVNNVAVASDGRIMRVAPVISELAEDISDLQIKDGYNVPANVVKSAKVGDVLSIDENKVIYINGNAILEDLIEYKFPDWLSVFRVASHTNIANVAKVSKDIKKAATTIKTFCAKFDNGVRPCCLSFEGLKWSLIGLDYDGQPTQTKAVTLADTKDNNYMSRMSGCVGYDMNYFLLFVADAKRIYLPSSASGYAVAMSSKGLVTLITPMLLEKRDTTFYNAGKDTGTDFFTDFGFTRIEPVTDGSLLNNASNVASFAAVTDNIAFADNTPASVEEHTNDTNDTNDTDKIYLPVVSMVSVPAVIVPAKEEKAEEHTDTMQPVIISLPVATVQPVEAFNAECVELVDDDTNDTDTDTTASDQEHTDHLVRRIFALAASYIAIVVMMVLAFGGNDKINANNIHTTAKESTQRVYFAAVDTLDTDTTETTTQRVYSVAPAVADTLVSDTLAADTLVSDTLVSDSIEEHTDTINKDTINSTPANFDDASDDTDTNRPAVLAIIPLVLPVIGTRKNHEKANENTNNNPSVLADTKQNKTMNATVTATKKMSSDMMQKFVNHIVEAKKTGEWDAPEKQYTGICGWAGVMSPDTRLACIEKFGMADTLTAETMANNIIARRREFWNNSNAKLAQDAATANEQNNDYQPKAGDFVWGYNTNLKADGGLMGAVRDMVYCLDEEGREKPAMRELVHIEKVLSVPTTCEEWKNPAIIVARDPQHFPGGCQSLDVEKDVIYDDLCDEEKDTFFTVAAAVVDESGRWYLVDAEGFDYARYILFPANFDTTFADELAAVRKENSDEKEAQAQQEAQEKAERLADYKARCAKWEPLMVDVRPVIESLKNYGYGTKERKDAERKLGSMRRANIATMIHTAFPGLKVSIRRSNGWGSAWELTYTDGPTEEQFNELTDLDLFVQRVETFDGMTDSTGVESLEFTDFAKKYMAIDYNGFDVVRNTSDEWKAEAVNKILSVAPDSSNYDAAGEYKRRADVKAISLDQAQTICGLFGVDADKINFAYCCDSAESLANAIWYVSDLYKAPETAKKAEKRITQAERVADGVQPVTATSTTAKSGNYKLEPYSAKCYQLTGDTYDIREQLREFGVWNRARQCWFISNKKAAKLADFLGIALA